MTGNRPLVVGISAVAVAVVVGFGLVLGPSALAPHPGPSGSLFSALAPSSSDRSIGAPLVATAYVDGAFDIAQTHEPTAGPAQSKLWFAENTWWATLIDPMPA